MILFEFQPDETGCNSFYVMSKNIEDAIKAVEAHPENDHYGYTKNKHKYEIFEYKENEVTFVSNC